MKPTKADREAAQEWHEIQKPHLTKPDYEKRVSLLAQTIAEKMAPEREQWADEQIKWGEEVGELRRMVADERERVKELVEAFYAKLELEAAETEGNVVSFAEFDAVDERVRIAIEGVKG